MSDFRTLKAYQKGFELAMEIFEVSKNFPKAECYSLTDQIRRSSRSICVNLAEGYRKRAYIKHFVAKISDADMENAETQTWLSFAHACEYITEEQHNSLLIKSEEIGRLLGVMLRNPQKFL